ncbi:MAG: DMT family protein [Pseudomonadales bacterium]|nr:DMT family protein [Pseudomonadales bacterium]
MSSVWRPLFECRGSRRARPRRRHIGHEVMSVGQLKILQEVITLLVFVPFSFLYLRERLTLDYLWAGLCLLGAVFFMFRSRFGT